MGEGAAIVALLFEAFFVDETQVDIFDAVLIQEGLEELVARRRVVLPTDAVADEDGGGGGGNPVGRLGEHMDKKGVVYAPFSLRQIVEFVVLLPLNLIPWVGVPAFVLLTGYRAGPLLHYRYYYLLGVDKAKKRELVGRRQLRYTWFGSVYLVLQLVPGLSMLFLLTTATGAALWVRDLEHSSVLVAADREEGGDGYRDDPS